ncbi:MAG: hypothetical protein AAGG38_11315 [Planctomycetota bacterium]
MPDFIPIPPDDAPRLEDPGDGDKLVLVKKGQRYCFDCPPGREHELIRQLQAMVADPHHDLNWFDAAVLSHRLGQRMSDRLTEHYRARKTA